MIKYRGLYILLLTFISCSFSGAQNIDSKDFNSVTRNLIQDKKGNIWIATFAGVFRYDGKSFINVTSGASSARFFSVLEDRKGDLWFGSIGSGVYRYNGKSFQNFTTIDGLLNNEVGWICEDRLGNIWFGVNGGASCYDGKAFRNYIINGDSIVEDRTGKSLPDTRPPNEVTSIAEDKTGKVWLGTRGNAFVYDGGTFSSLPAKYNKRLMNVRSIIEDKKGNVWFGGADGLWRYDGHEFKNFATHFVGYVYEDKHGNIWTSSGPEQNWVLSRYEAKSLWNETPTVTELKPNVGMIFGILEDDKGNIWFGSGGVYRYDGKIITDFRTK